MASTPGSAFAAYLHMIVRYAGPRRIAGLCALILTTALTDGIGLLVLVPLVEGISGTGSHENWVTSSLRTAGLPASFEAVLISFVLLQVLRSILVRTRDIATTTLRLEIVDHMRARLVNSVAYADWPFLVKRRIADITNTIASDVNRIAQGTLFLLRIPAIAMLVLVQCAIAVRLSPLLALLALAVAAVIGAAMRSRLRRVLQLGRDVTVAGQGIFRQLSELFGGIKLAKSHALEQRHVEACVTASDTLRHRTLRFIRSQSFNQMLFQIGSSTALGLLVYIAVSVAKLPTANLVVLIAILARTLPMLMELAQGLDQVVFMLPAFEAAEQLVAECDAAAEPLAVGEPLPPLARGIRFDHVSFRYAADNPTVLDDISLAIPANQTTALCGPSGAGKTTLVDLVLGLLAPTTGQLILDGEPLTADHARAWRSQIAYVPQESFLFHDTVAANLRWGRPQATDEELWSALDVAAAKPFVAKLPHGLETIVGDRGAQLSGGERQRIALARALLVRPRLLVLDEATSALDEDNARAVFDALERVHGTLTIVLVAHRLSALRSADHIHVIDHGQLVETGTWAELNNRQGWFAEAVASQRAPAREGV